MPFESLAYRYKFEIENFPEKWIPLIHLYDPDLPSFPIYYFHVLSPSLTPGERPTHISRVFGYIERINVLENNRAEIRCITNKNLESPANQLFLEPVKNEIKERLGLNNPVTESETNQIFLSPLTVPIEGANNVSREMWHRVVSQTYGGRLPFGRLWDHVLGLTRFVSSWYSPGGRHSELIQTHYFVTKFGERIQSANEIPQIDFFLLPTIHELTDTTNPLILYPNFSKLLHVADIFQRETCDVITISGISLSSFRGNRGNTGRFNSERFKALIHRIVPEEEYRSVALECHNAFNKGPDRPVIYLMMLDDLRKGRYRPDTITAQQCGDLYDLLKGQGTSQSPKVIAIYAQQCFGNQSVMPFDTWMDSIFQYPYNLYREERGAEHVYSTIFSLANNLGKIERLLWVTSQARKIHSSACNDALWCIKYGEAGKKKIRGANPFSCNICLTAIREVCPAYNRIKDFTISFNQEDRAANFLIITSAGNNTDTNQKFKKCSGKSIYKKIVDEFSPIDDPDGFSPFPHPNHMGRLITVDEFVRMY